MSGGHAHYVIVDGAGHRVWSRHRGALSLYQDVLKGPERMIAFIHEQEGGHRDFWMNSVWWQGVALLDLRERHLLVHTDQEMAEYGRPTSVFEIRAWLRLVASAWPGWRVTWASRGLHQVMEHLGLPYDTVLYLDDPPPELPTGWAQAPTEDNDLSRVAEVVIAVRDAGGALSFSGWWATGLDTPLLAGPDRLLSPKDEAVPFAALDAVPWSGVYLDAQNRTLDYWSLDCPLDLRELAGRWSGWRLTGHGDRFEDVLPLIGPEIVLDAGTEEAAYERVAGWFAT
ncbi:hypothetical protein AB0I81_15225 [Nonomuraea sp. NPDC050404]|uniref:hypothetical protein n=1 Tax=Nonomuraea sp. NPDC050404 TaxID=3155783 RepID=UPI0033FEA118